MAAVRTLLCLVFAAAPAFWLPVAAEFPSGAARPKTSDPGEPPRGAWLPGTRSYLGLNVGRSGAAGCAPTALLCNSGGRPVEIYTGTMIGSFWGVEMAYLDPGRLPRPGAAFHAQGLNMSLVGKAQLAPSLRVFGKLGTTYGRTESAIGSVSSPFASEQGFGLSFGGGLSLDFTPRLSATLEWDSNDFRFQGASRDPVRSTSLGLRYRY